jgi:hypothetical protein
MVRYAILIQTKLCDVYNIKTLELSRLIKN